MYLAQLHKCPVLLGSATPAVETYYNCTTGKYALVELPVRYNNLPLPEFKVIDMADLFKKKSLKPIFAPALIEHIEACLNNREQVILFQNRRGFALWLECQSCYHIPECPHCDVTLTYHKKENALKCHYCGYKTFIPDKCPSCSSTRMQMKSYGTERLEDELNTIFPKAKIARMDFDTTRSKHAFQELINDFEARKVDIMVGTQMLSKGMDFDNVGLVGVLNVDNMLHFPDFRSFERAFQLVAQVSGRTGRKTKRGKVILQCYDAKHFVVACIVNNDYQQFYKHQIEERKKFFYPPFSRLIHLSLRHRQRDTLDKATALLAENLRTRLPKRILGPEYPYINKIRNEYIKDILVKVEKGYSSQKIREIIKEETERVRSNTEFCALKLVADVDPM
ncbi:MAG: Primosomal protein N' [Bacteroidetes bacterium ADurb.Bin408]|nr:MAG: Primosomal protein N' [Bacteroidetes bacterium ADurb.Bin408]